MIKPNFVLLYLEVIVDGGAEFIVDFSQLAPKHGKLSPLFSEPTKIHMLFNCVRSNWNRSKLRKISLNNLFIVQVAFLDFSKSPRTNYLFGSFLKK